MRCLHIKVFVNRSIHGQSVRVHTCCIGYVTTFICSHTKILSINRSPTLFYLNLLSISPVLLSLARSMCWSTLLLTYSRVSVNDYNPVFHVDWLRMMENRFITWDYDEMIIVRIIKVVVVLCWCEPMCSEFNKYWFEACVRWDLLKINCVSRTAEPIQQLWRIRQFQFLYSNYAISLCVCGAAARVYKKLIKWLWLYWW